MSQAGQQNNFDDESVADHTAWGPCSSCNKRATPYSRHTHTQREEGDSCEQKDGCSAVVLLCWRGGGYPLPYIHDVGGLILSTLQRERVL
jgi:hypothetical protein